MPIGRVTAGSTARVLDRRVQPVARALGKRWERRLPAGSWAPPTHGRFPSSGRLRPQGRLEAGAPSTWLPWFSCPAALGHLPRGAYNRSISKIGARPYFEDSEDWGLTRG